jgi:Arc/MetJ family transcription regulator
MATREPMQAEIAAFLEAQPRMLTYSALADALAARFGAAAWDAETIRAFFLRSDRLTVGRAQISRDPEIRAFIRDRIGRQRGEEILAALRAAFPADRVPSRSSLYRFLQAEACGRRPVNRARRAKLSSDDPRAAAKPPVKMI